MNWLGMGLVLAALSAAVACSDDSGECAGANCIAASGGAGGQSNVGGQSSAGGNGGTAGEAGHSGGAGGSGGEGGGPVLAAPNWVECPAFPGGSVNTPWSITCTLSGYPAPDMDVLGIEDGTPYPNWMGFDYDQALGSVTFSGTPDGAGDFGVEINLTNSEGFLQVVKYFTIQP